MQKEKLKQKIHDYVYKIKISSKYKKFKTDYSFLFLLLLSFISIIFIVSLFSSKLLGFETIYNYLRKGLDIKSLQSLISIGVTLFGTLLALYWAIVSSIYTQTYVEDSLSLKSYFFKIVQSKLITFITCFYLLGNFALYISIDYYLISREYYTLFFHIWFYCSSCLLLYFSFLSIRIFEKIDYSFMYSEIAKTILKQINNLSTYQNRFIFFPIIDDVYSIVTLLYETLEKHILKLSPTNILKFLYNNIKILEKYWKIKNTIYYDCDWYHTVLKSNSIIDISLTGRNEKKTRDTFYLEKFIFQNNELLFKELYNRKQFLILTLYYDKIREMLSLEEKENIYTYNMPSYNETLILLLNEVEKSFQIIKTEDDFKNNQNNINLYGLVSILNTVLGSLFMNNQKFLFKFMKVNIDNNIPTYKDITNIKTIQDLLIKFPVINNDNGLKTYNKIFLEKNVEDKIITIKKDFELECNKTIIQNEFINCINLIKDIENLFIHNLKFYADSNSPYYFFDTFFALLCIKHELIVQINNYQEIYETYYQIYDFEGTLWKKITKLFNYNSNFPNWSRKIIKTYRDNNYFLQKEYPNLINDIYMLLINILIQYVKNKKEEFNFEIKDTIKITFHFMFTSHQLIIKEMENQENNAKKNNEDVYIAYFIPFIKFASIIGAILQKKTLEYKEVEGIFLKTLLIEMDLKEYFDNMVANLVHNGLISFQFYPIIQQIEKELTIENTIGHFIGFYQKVSEKINDK